MTNVLPLGSEETRSTPGGFTKCHGLLNRRRSSFLRKRFSSFGSARNERVPLRLASYKSRDSVDSLRSQPSSGSKSSRSNALRHRFGSQSSLVLQRVCSSSSVDSSPSLTEQESVSTGEKGYAATTVLENTASTGDLVLFRSKGWGTRLQRYLTMSDFDHVGLVLRDEGKIDFSVVRQTVTSISASGIYILEAVHGPGVICSPWESFSSKQWLNQNQRIVLRQIRYHGRKRRMDVNFALWKFAESAVGLPYRLDLRRLLTQSPLEKSESISEHDFSGSHDEPLIRRSATFDTAAPKSDTFQERSFFCSQLVAEALKCAGVFDPGVGASGFWPVCFSLLSNYPLPLMKGFRYASFYVPIFSE